ncbi:hypothetical protein [Nocardioides solisilvae]|uniref:hypothetical protein n=1 Tax=Nocardioides solisilvae TaxID=1542435 RepID=UPI000D748584|nr:hypothetical protein [Nocardioides solisilvae]
MSRCRRAPARLVAPLVAALAAPVLLGLLAAPATAAPPAPPAPTGADPAEPTVELPLVATLPVGESLVGPHLEDRRTLVDGDVRVPVPADVRILGRVGRTYVVQHYRRGGASDVLRVARDGTRRTVAEGVDEVQMAPDGRTVVTSRLVRFRTEVRLLDARTGRVVKRRTIDDGVWAIDMDERRVLLGGIGGASGGTHLWNYRSDRDKRISAQSADAAELDAGVYARRTDDQDQYSGGCSVVAKVGSGKELWRTCESVSSFSSDGRSVLTGGNYGRVARVRTVRGEPVVRLRTHRDETIEHAEWSADGRVVLHVLDEVEDTVLVACTMTECARLPEGQSP